MTGMNADVRDAVKAALEQKGMTQAELARRIGMERPNLHRLLSGKSGQVPEAWQKILKELGLELTARPVDGELDVEAYRARQAYIDERTDKFLDEYFKDQPESLKKSMRPHFRNAVEQTELFILRGEIILKDQKKS